MDDRVGVAKSEEFAADWFGRNVTASDAPAENPQKTIEFIGDSYFVGYGNLLPESARERDGLPSLWVDRFTDHHQGMAALCGSALNRRHNVTWRVIARSGYGMLRNYPTLADRTPLSADYANLVSQFSSDREQSAVKTAPEIVVINLGTNDFSTPLGANEPFANARALKRGFITAYHHFLDELSLRYPGVVFLLVGIPHPSSRCQPLLLRQITEARKRISEPVHFCCLPEVPLTGCDGHPGLAGHRVCAEVLTEAIDLIFTTANNKLALGVNHAQTTV